MARTRRSSTTASASSPSSTSAKSPLLFHRSNLGDKLQILAHRSPKHVNVVELLVDTILKRLDRESAAG